MRHRSLSRRCCEDWNKRWHRCIISDGDYFEGGIISHIRFKYSIGCFRFVVIMSWSHNKLIREIIDQIFLNKKTDDEGQTFETIIYNKYKWGIYHWRTVTFQPGDAVQKNSLHFFNFLLLFAFFCKFHLYSIIEFFVIRYILYIYIFIFII